MSADLVAFMRARLAEDERGAGDVHLDSCNWVLPLPGSCDCGYPDRVRAEVAAKRAILDQAADWLRYEPPPNQRHLHDVAVDTELGEVARRLLRLLAQPYAGHPEFDLSWPIT